MTLIQIFLLNFENIDQQKSSDYLCGDTLHVRVKRKEKIERTIKKAYKESISFNNDPMRFVEIVKILNAIFVAKLRTLVAQIESMDPLFKCS